MGRYLDDSDTDVSEGRTCQPSDHIPALVSVAGSEELTADAAERPDSTPAVVRLAVDGESYETRIDYAPEHARNPLSRAELEAKLVGMAEPLLTGDQIDTLVRTTERLDEQPRVDDLVGALTV